MVKRPPAVPSHVDADADPPTSHDQPRFCHSCGTAPLRRIWSCGMKRFPYIAVVVLALVVAACEGDSGSPPTRESDRSAAVEVGERQNAAERTQTRSVTADFGPLVSSNRPAGWIGASEAASAVGSRKTVCGSVESPTYASSSRGRPTFLNLDRPYPSQIFTMVIWGENRSAFPEAPERLYRGREICVTGLIETYQGLPQIIAASPTQIQIVD